MGTETNLYISVETGRDKNELGTERGRDSFPTEFCSRYSPPPISCELWYKGEKRPQKQGD